MRRTMFVVPTDLAAVMDAACTQALAPPERRRLEGLVADQGLAADAGPWLADVEAQVLEALARRGEATAVELTEDVPELGLKLSFGEGKTWGGTQGLSTRILFLLATEARIVRGRPLGSWISSQYRWAPTDTWLGGDLASWDDVEARAELLRRWLRTFGPGTATDLKWWTGWTVAKTKAALAAVEAVEVDLDGGTGWVLPDDLEPVEDPEPWVALLPGLDPTVMGWKERAWYLGEHGPVLFDTNGNAGPTVWVDGRVVGGWSQDPEGSVVFRLLEDVGADARAAVEAEVARLDEWLAGVRVTSRFPTPLQRELAAGP
jgi:DNA glycosylase AlkZ-like